MAADTDLTVPTPAMTNMTRMAIIAIITAARITFQAFVDVLPIAASVYGKIVPSFNSKNSKIIHRCASPLRHQLPNVSSDVFCLCQYQCRVELRRTH